MTTTFVSAPTYRILSYPIPSTHEVRAYVRSYQSVYRCKVRGERRKKLLEILGNKCCRQGCDERRGLQVHHLNGSGAVERGNFDKFLRYYTENPIEATRCLQLLCCKHHREERS